MEEAGSAAEEGGEVEEVTGVLVPHGAEEAEGCATARRGGARRGKAAAAAVVRSGRRRRRR